MGGGALKIVRTELIAWVGKAGYIVVSPRLQQRPEGRKFKNDLARIAD